MGTHVPATPPLKRTCRATHTEKQHRTPAPSTYPGRPQRTPCRATCPPSHTVTGACAAHLGHRVPLKGQGQTATQAGSPPGKLHAQGTKDPVFTPRGSGGNGWAGGSLCHVTSVDLRMRYGHVPPCPEPSVAPVTGSKPEPLLWRLGLG